MSYSKMLKYTGNMVPVIVKHICSSDQLQLYVLFFIPSEMYTLFSTLLPFHHFTLYSYFLTLLLRQIPKCHFCTTILTGNSF